MMRVLTVALLICGVACASSKGVEVKPSNLTPGMTKKFIYPGKTTQTEIMEIFGPPDLVTRRDGTEVWTYDKISQDVSSSGGFVTILIAGYSKQSAHSSNRSTMLIIYFDKNDRVVDYKLSASKF